MSRDARKPLQPLRGHRFLTACLLSWLCTAPLAAPLPRRPSFGPKRVNGYPIYLVDGKPFLPYATAFFYDRIPADLWSPSLVRLRKLGFNTIDIYVPWNWHQPSEDVVDLDGRTNPRRNLRRVLALAASMGLKVILRPGPFVFNEWRNGGYPAWLLQKSPLGMSEAAIEEGWFPIPSSLQYIDANLAAQLWLKDDAHWKNASKWIRAVWQAVGSYSAVGGGPIIAVQIEDDLAVGYRNSLGPTFWRYLRRYQDMFRSAGIDVPLFINAAFTRDTAELNRPTFGHPIWDIGQWYLRTGKRELDSRDVLALQFTADSLGTQPDYPAMLIEFNTNQYAGPLDTHGQVVASPQDSLLASRILLQNGLRGLNVYPAEDTLFPAGWELPVANYYYSWESALDAGLKERSGRVKALERDGRLIGGMGTLLAATHTAPDAGLVYGIAAYAQRNLRRQDMQDFARRFLDLQQLAYEDHVTLSYVDPLYQPASDLDRYPVLILPAGIFRSHRAQTENLSGSLEMSPIAQRKLIGYVKQGGTLVVTPQLPNASLMAPLFGDPRAATLSKPSEKVRLKIWNGTSLSVYGPLEQFHFENRSGTKLLAFVDGTKSKVGYERRFGRGKVIVLGFNFYNWVQHGSVPTMGHWAPVGELDEREKKASLGALLAILHESGKSRIAVPLVSAADPTDPFLYTSEMVSDSTAKPPYGFIAATNLSGEVREADIRVHIGEAASTFILSNVEVPKRDSVLLPIEIPLNRLTPGAGHFGQKEALVYSTAELTAAKFANGAFTFQLYAPSKSEMVMRLKRPPYGNCTSGGQVLKVTYESSTHLARIKVPAGQLPNFVVSVRVPYAINLPILGIQATSEAVAGTAVAIHVDLRNPGNVPLRGRLDLETPRSWPAPSSQPVSLPATGQENPAMLPIHDFKFLLHVPADTPPGSAWQIRACIRGPIIGCSEPFLVHTVNPIKWQLKPRADFPVRDDVHLPTLPVLTSITLPGSVIYKLTLTNAVNRPISAQLAFSGEHLRFEVDHHLRFVEGYTIRFQPHERVTVPITVWPRPPAGSERTPTSVYPFRIRIRIPEHVTTIPVCLIGIRTGEALVYHFDFDRDGFQDLVLENEYLRLILMPAAGGTGFALIDKGTGKNATDSVGALRDAFTKSIPTYLWKDHDLRRRNWRWPELRLYNRKAKARVLDRSGRETSVALSYQAGDVYPAGAIIRKTLVLRGGSHLVRITYEVILKRGSADQSFRTSVSTQISGRDHPSGQVLVPTRRGVVSHHFEAGGKITPRRSTSNWIGAFDPASSELFGLFWKGPERMVIAEQQHSSLLELITPPLPTSQPFRFEIGYYFSHAGLHALEESYRSFRNVEH